MLVMSSARPETAMSDGYGVAGPLATGGNAIAVELLNVSARASEAAAPSSAHRKQVASA
jgi:hypothetical protein